MSDDIQISSDSGSVEYDNEVKYRSIKKPKMPEKPQSDKMNDLNDILFNQTMESLSFSSEAETDKSDPCESSTESEEEKTDCYIENETNYEEVKFVKEKDYAIEPARVNDVRSEFLIKAPFHFKMPPKSFRVIDLGFRCSYVPKYVLFCFLFKDHLPNVTQRRVIVEKLEFDYTLNSSWYVLMHNLSDETQIFEMGDTIARMYIHQIWERPDVSFQFIIQKSVEAQASASNSASSAPQN